MRVARKAIASAATGLIAALFPLSTAFAGNVGTCALPSGCLDVDAPDDVVDTADEVGEGAGKVLDDAKETTDKVTGGGTDPVTEPVVEGVKRRLDLTPGHADPASGKKHEKKGAGGDRTSGVTSPGARTGIASTAAYQHSVDMMAAREARRNLGGNYDRAVSFLPPSEPGLGERLAQAALDAAKAFTFPAILIGLIVGFVLVQNRIDRRDPKLAYAPVSSEQDYLGFS